MRVFLVRIKKGNEGLERQAGWANADSRWIVSPLSLLKNPMILIAVVGLAFVVGMPYLLDNSMFRPFFLPGLMSLSTWKR